MLKYYALHSIKGEGWAHISLNTGTGFFATVSDWGNYSFMWTSPGGEFRAFLMKLQPDYLYGKLMMGRPDTKVFNGHKTKDNIIEAIEDYNKGSTGGWPYYEEELAVVKAHSFEDEGDFEAWQSETRLTDVWEYSSYSPAPDCMGFCEKIWPRFVELLKKELEEELAQNKPSPRYRSMHEQASSEMNAAEDEAFVKECDAAAKAMTGPDRNG